MSAQKTSVRSHLYSHLMVTVSYLNVSHLRKQGSILSLCPFTWHAFGMLDFVSNYGENMDFAV